MLEIEERDLGGGYVEGYYTEDPRPAYLALQKGLPNSTKQARAIEGAGLYRKPPPEGRKIMLLHDSLDSVDEAAIVAMRPVVEDHLSAADVNCIRGAYLASTNGDAYWIAWDCHVHPYVVVAILRNLDERGELPPHPGWA